MKNKTVLNVKDLHVRIPAAGGAVNAVRGVSFSVKAGRVLGLVGESGCGKTVTCLALAGLINSPGLAAGGAVELNGRNIAGLPGGELRALRGREIAMILQHPMSAFNPMLTLGLHFEETLTTHTGMTAKQAREAAVSLLGQVGLPRPGDIMRQYPFQLSGGMLQRVMIAIALGLRPAMLIADEPTTALDVTVRRQIIGQLERLRNNFNTGILLVSHDLAVIAQLADEVAVMYSGYIVEKAPVMELYDHPLHPYTRALLASRPGMKKERLQAIEGQPPSMADSVEGCPFLNRCRMAAGACLEYGMEPFTRNANHMVRCVLYRMAWEAIISEPAGA
jgi:oligopeptide/dipeptide ABC transporter ATP-binding protein